jgi:HKD family nuclease
MSKAGFEEMFDMKLYNKFRHQFGCEDAFPHVYDKISRRARSFMIVVLFISSSSLLLLALQLDKNFINMDFKGYVTSIGIIRGPFIFFSF